MNQHSNDRVVTKPIGLERRDTPLPRYRPSENLRVAYDVLCCLDRQYELARHAWLSRDPATEQEGDEAGLFSMMENLREWRDYNVRAFLRRFAAEFGL